MLERDSSSVNPKSRALALLLLSALTPLAPAVSACHLLERDLLLAYELIAPLTVALGPTLVVRVDRSGCAEVKRFAFAARPGIVRARLTKRELAELVADIESLPADLDPLAAKLALRELDRDRDWGFAVSDAPIRRFRLAPEGRSPLVFTWNNLEQDLLNHGEVAELHLIAEWSERLEGLARRIGAENPP